MGSPALHSTWGAPRRVSTLRLFRAGDAVGDEFEGALCIDPLADAGPFAGLQILIVLEEVRDLLEQDLRQVRVGVHAVIKRMQIVRRYRDDLLIGPRLI